ncbi:Disease resistance protein [Actinidia chinensis var. chinensis]|uniref:Disease resistance protein n=1 Tax=Actinidia chinensis var. chinensis TaxID=1590841 RepID=A0A2R6RA57_ACTCC|nr:Disease resistance protein [Actinidia chinensis var. chinensis]
MECGYTSLENFELISCDTLTHLPLDFFPHLEHLTIESCPNLLSFSSDGLPPTLKNLSVRDCEKLVVPLSEEMKRCYTSLERLMLIRCDRLTHLPLDFFPKLESLFIDCCKNFETLSIADRRGLQILTSLKSVRIMYCRSMVSFPQGGLLAPNLWGFELQSCLKLKILPEQMQTVFPSLESLALHDCPEIESFPDEGLPSNLRSLRISNCKKLVDRRREWGLQRLPSLRRFVLRDDEDVGDSFPEEGLLPSTLTTLWIENLSNLKSLSKRGFQFLRSLTSLLIWGCPQLRSLPEEGFLASLEFLSIWCCLNSKPYPKRDFLTPSLS